MISTPIEEAPVATVQEEKSKLLPIEVDVKRLNDILWYLEVMKMDNYTACLKRVIPYLEQRLEQDRYVRSQIEGTGL